MIQKIKSLMKPNSARQAGCVTLGKVSGSSWRKELLSEAQLNHHVHIVGASGYGKTVLLSHIIEQRIAQHKGLLFIDLKGDRETIEKMCQMAVRANRASDLSVFSLNHKDISRPYNLIGDGSATQVRDRILSALEWSEEYYKNQAASFLLKLLIVLCWLRDHAQFRFSLATILDLASDPRSLVEVGQKIPPNEPRLKLALQNLKDFLEIKDNYQSLQGLRTQLESLVLSDFGELITSTEKGIDLFQAVAAGKIVFIYLDTRRYNLTARAVGRFILQDLKSVSARIDAEIPQSQRVPFTVVIDEFSDLAQEDFIGFLDRARSSRMAVVVAHQEICDLDRISPEFAGRLIGNTSTLYAFLQKRPESAEMISGIAGTKRVWKTTQQTSRFAFLEIETGAGSKREVEEFVVHPNQIKSLKVGKCICIKKYPEARAYLVDVNSQ